MVSYIQPTNRNSFSLRYKKYKRLRKDVWGRLALQNKKNYLTTIIKIYAQRDLTRRIRYLPVKRRKAIYKKLKLKKKRTFFQYAIEKKPKIRLGAPYDFRVSFKYYAKTLRFFYYLRRTKSSLRKLFASRPKPMSHSKIPTTLEGRADVLFYRANLVDNVREARQLIKNKHLSYLLPKQRKRNAFVNQKIISKPYTQIPIFAFFKLSPLYAFRRKKVLYHALRSKKKLFSPQPAWIFSNYKLMVSLLLYHTPFATYTFHNAKSVMMYHGAARYF